MKQSKNKKGFTLIELMVVIAIIGILASVVIVVLNSARKKGQDSAIQTQMTSLRSQAEIYASTNNGSYDNLFIGNNTWASTNAPMQEILTSINKQTLVHTAGSIANTWAAQAQLQSDPTKYICVDYTAIVKTNGNVLTAGNTVCP